MKTRISRRRTTGLCPAFSRSYGTQTGKIFQQNNFAYRTDLSLSFAVVIIISLFILQDRGEPGASSRMEDEGAGELSLRATWGSAIQKYSINHKSDNTFSIYMFIFTFFGTHFARKQMKTVSVALVICLNVGVDPPGLVKLQPCARLESW